MQSAEVGRWFKDGQVICRQGELGDCLYIIGKGQVELMRRDGSTEFCLRVLEAGDIWGEGGLLERDHMRTATARAIGDVCVLTIEKRMFLDRIHEDPSFVLKIMRKMSSRIRELEDALVRTAGPQATELQAAAQVPTGSDRNG
jgi:CRP/FNR family cyclic AMP-dependent transcriptional regulator